MHSYIKFEIFSINFYQFVTAYLSKISRKPGISLQLMLIFLLSFIPLKKILPIIWTGRVVNNHKNKTFCNTLFLVKNTKYKVQFPNKTHQNFTISSTFHHLWIFISINLYMKYYYQYGSETEFTPLVLFYCTDLFLYYFSTDSGIYQYSDENFQH